MFSPADWLPPIGFSWAPLVIRLEWAAALVATALGLRRADARRTRGLLNLLAVATAALYAALVQQTGGALSPLFQWSVAMPAIVALVVQGHASAVARLRSDADPGAASPSSACGSRRRSCWRNGRCR